MDAGRLGDAGTFFCLFENLLDRTQGDVAFPFGASKQPFLGMVFFPVSSQMLKDGFGQDGVAVFASLAVTHPDCHPLAVDIGQLQAG